MPTVPQVILQCYLVYSSRIYEVAILICISKCGELTRPPGGTRQRWDLNQSDQACACSQKAPPTPEPIGLESVNIN